MSTAQNQPGSPLVAVCGPTGSGKSSLSLFLAHIFSGEVINCDSLQVYRHFDIGTAKLPEEERGTVRHHLIDVVEAHEGFTAGDFARASRGILQEITARGHLPLVTGGTGFYLRAMLDGLSPAPPSSGFLRERLTIRERRRPGSLHKILSRLDAESGFRIHPRDTAKVLRALEIRILSSRKASEQPKKDSLAGYRVLKLGLFPPREDLYSRLDHRCQAMLDRGLFEEVEQILQSGISRDSKPFQSLGYKEALAVRDGRMTRDIALEQMQRHTRHYAKRQITWFRHEPGIIALYGFGDDPAIERSARDRVQALIDSD